MKEREDLMEQKVTHKQWLIVSWASWVTPVPQDIIFIKQWIVVATYILDGDIGGSKKSRWREIEWDFEWPHGKGESVDRPSVPVSRSFKFEDRPLSS